jgi:hypothetical protein
MIMAVPHPSLILTGYKYTMYS